MRRVKAWIADLLWCSDCLRLTVHPDHIRHVIGFLRRFFRAPVEVETAATRWRRINAEAKAAGCKCGRPGTHVRYFGPAAYWSCEEHQNVNRWSRVGGGTWVPVEMSAEEAANLAKWQTVTPRPYTDVDRIRGGVYEVKQDGAGNDG